MSSGHAEPRDVNAVCVDVIFYLFICPAMVDPNPVGIIDTPISYIARSNLMQVYFFLFTLCVFKQNNVLTNQMAKIFIQCREAVIRTKKLRIKRLLP